MKLRIRGDSLRLRLTQTEVQRIGQGKSVEDSIAFTSKHSLRYELQPSRTILNIGCRYEHDLISVLIPLKMAVEWSRSGEIALQGEQTIDDNRKTKVLIEKDFACLKPRQHESEDESDLFSNPNATHGSCGGPP